MVRKYWIEILSILVLVVSLWISFDRQEPVSAAPSYGDIPTYSDSSPVYVEKYERVGPSVAPVYPDECAYSPDQELAPDVFVCEDQVEDHDEEGE